MLKISKVKEDEEVQKQRELERTMEESMARLKDLQFSFSFTDSSV